MYDSKKALREAMLKTRNSLSGEMLGSMSEIIQARVLNMDEFIDARTVGAYHPLGSEVDTVKVLSSALQMEKRLTLPRVVDQRRMVFAEVKDLATDLEAGRYKIMEPKDHCPEVKRLELLLLPGVAWDQKGHRLGYGKGYYDRFLVDAHTHTTCAGLAYDFQVLESIPHGNGDLSVDLIVTEKRIIIKPSK